MSKTLGVTEMRAVAATDMFRGVSAKCLALLLRDARVQEHPAGTVLFVQGDDAAACYVVLEGWVKLFRSTVVGEEAVIGVLTACQSFAEAPALGRRHLSGERAGRDAGPPDLDSRRQPPPHHACRTGDLHDDAGLDPTASAPARARDRRA